MLDLKMMGDWSSDKVAQSYVARSTFNKRRLSSLIGLDNIDINGTKDGGIDCVLGKDDEKRFKLDLGHGIHFSNCKVNFH